MKNILFQICLHLGCGIKFKSVSNLQAHQARYCAGLRKASEEAFEAMMLKQKQQQQQQQQKALPMLEMMSLLNAKSSLEPEKLSSLMMSSMMAAMSSAANASSSSSSGKEMRFHREKGYLSQHTVFKNKLLTKVDA